MTEVKTGLSCEPEHVNDIFEFIEKPQSLPINLQFRSEDQNYDDGVTIKLAYWVHVLLH